MKKIDLNTFVFQFIDEVRDFEEAQTALNLDPLRTKEEWVNNFLVYSGYENELEEDFSREEYDDDIYYGDSFEYQDLVNRRKYKSFRDDDRY